ncbi:hypothetical protein HYC85_016824 [Camellia sinensis]|uniref:Uncharacterized protein n=1 Tax=Camellia sinensis TaxID=4442 RepID=A0A7J7H4D7_CAMSI|nr:hypothetical protein HYC85_016824 [Camellia sinensis]
MLTYTGMPESITFRLTKPQCINTPITYNITEKAAAAMETGGVKPDPATNVAGSGDGDWSHLIVHERRHSPRPPW